MLRARTKSLLIGAVVLLALGASVPQADAHWGWGWGYAPYYSASYASYAPCYGCGYDGWYVGVRPGIVRRALFGPYRWYYGGYYAGHFGGYYTSGCCTSCYCDPCCCDGGWTVGCSDCGGGIVVQSPATPQPAQSPTPAPTRAPAPPKMDEGTMPGPASLPTDLDAAPKGTGTVFLQSYVQVDNRSNSGLLTIYVPLDAAVTVNGRPTTSAGSERSFVSFGLEPGLRYKYEVRAEVIRDGKPLAETKTVYLTAGANEGVAFGFNRPVEGLATAE